MPETNTIASVFRERRYTYSSQWCSWFEPCPVVAESDKFVTVRSQTYETINYPGGDFRLDKEKLLSAGKQCHSRHGEWFYLKKPRLGDLFPSKELLAMPDFVLQEAVAIGWDISQPIHAWAEWQKLSWLHATLSKTPLRESVNIWKSGGLGSLEQSMQDFHAEQHERMMLMISAEGEQEH